jgi:hypothetical protein
MGMSKKRKINCLIDSCSYIHLKKCELTWQKKDTDLLSVLSAHTKVSIKYSEAVHREIGNSKRDKIQNLGEHSISEDSYLNTLFEGKLKSPQSSDIGEKHNLIIGIDMFYQFHRLLIFLSDDEPATDNQLKETFATFPYFVSWNSLDVVLFCYFTLYDKGFSKDLAQDAIRDLANLFYDNQESQEIKSKNSKKVKITEPDNEKTAKIMRLLVLYSKRLELISQLIS